MSKYSVIILALSLLLTGCTNPFKARVVSKVLDGDTIELNTGERVRLACIDAPELSQPLGIMSRNWLNDMINDSNRLVSLESIGRDRWGRNISVVRLKRDKIANVEMVEIGMAFGYTQFASQCPVWDKVQSAENRARSEGLGVWQQGNVERPWDYRRNRRNQQPHRDD